VLFFVKLFCPVFVSWTRWKNFEGITRGQTSAREMLLQFPREELWR
jgi:hypothetical protein